MSAVLVFTEEHGDIEVPLGLSGLGAFRSWAASDAYPPRGRFDYIASRIEVDMSPEDLWTHGLVKTEIVRVLANRVKALRLGELYSDRTRVTVPAADLSVEPDVVFIALDSGRQGRVRLVPKAGGGDRYIEIEGPPELVVEIVSDSSVRKDTLTLPDRYYAAAVTEYWLVDARGAEVSFQLLRRGAERYEPAPRDADGFQHSQVLDGWYRLVRSINAAGRPEYDLAERA